MGEGGKEEKREGERLCTQREVEGRGKRVRLVCSFNHVGLMDVVSLDSKHLYTLSNLAVLNVILIYIFLRSNEPKNPFMCLLAIYILWENVHSDPSPNFNFVFLLFG